MAQGKKRDEDWRPTRSSGNREEGVEREAEKERGRKLRTEATRDDFRPAASRELSV